MLFNSWKFFLFFGIVLALYWLLDRKKQNVLLVGASYLFYSAWDYRFTALLFATTFLGFHCGRKIRWAASDRERKAYLLVSVLYNLGTLAVFKYFGFFTDNMQILLSRLGLEAGHFHLDIILPVGISFFNFHVLSYTIDLYRKEIEPSPRFMDFALFVSFFPLLVAGPIERAKHLLPQIYASRSLGFTAARQGIWLLFWGLWKKVFVAENLAPLVDKGFAQSAALSFTELYLILIAFAFQIYCDFSGYTDMARGCARLMGFDLLKNFNLPYFATDPSDFWKRWHISLSSWLRDYLYFGLGGNRRGKLMTYRNLFLTMAIGGLWHGAAWNYVLWGVYQGVILILYHFYTSRATMRLPNLIAIPLMAQFTLFGWMLFRANRSLLDNGYRIDDSWRQIKELSGALGRGFSFDAGTADLASSILFFTAPLLLVQALQYACKDMDIVSRFPAPLRIAFKSLLLFLLVRYGVQTAGSFIYFQF